MTDDVEHSDCKTQMITDIKKCFTNCHLPKIIHLDWVNEERKTYCYISIITEEWRNYNDELIPSYCSLPEEYFNKKQFKDMGYEADALDAYHFICWNRAKVRGL